MNARVIAIDGPAASGKSTVARRVAARLGDVYVDSGALYRGVAWAALAAGIDVWDAGAVAAWLPALRIEVTARDGAVVYIIDGVEPGSALREERVNRAVSPIAAVPEVRRRVVACLRGLTALGNLVMEGRDIGTAVFPSTPNKFYLDASPEERARRRHRDMAAARPGLAMGEVGQALERRDRLDSGRAADPLRVADDARVIDSTGLSIDDVVRHILDRLPDAVVS